MKISPKTIIVFLLYMCGFASEILTLSTQSENHKSNAWMPEIARIINQK